MPDTASKVQIRRALTGTPLSRQYQRARFLRRRAPVIPWQKFDASLYPEPALELCVDATTALARGEYGAVDAFARVASALARNGAPFDLVSAATNIPGDELRHTEYALHLASLCAGEELSVEMERTGFDMPWGGAVGMEELDMMMLQLSTISETLAAALIDACREHASDPVARAMYAGITRDEVHHLRLGWYYFAWREPQWTQAERQRIADVAGETVAGIERQFWNGRDAPRGSKKAARALGVLDSPGQRRTIRRVMERELVPGLDALGLGASHAWRIRARGSG